MKKQKIVNKELLKITQQIMDMASKEMEEVTWRIIEGLLDRRIEYKSYCDRLNTT